jgi:hypothetical protein
MEEIDFYELKDWGMPEWIDGKGDFPAACSNLFIDLSHNTHPMASNILYANFEMLDKAFASWFFLQRTTLFLYEKLKKRFNHEIMYNHQSELTYFHLTQDEPFDEIWKYRAKVLKICETEPMSKITFPYEDLNWHSLAANPHKCVIEFLKEDRKNINWAKLSENSSDAAVAFLLEERRNIDWWNASSNTHEKMIALFEEEKENLSYYRLSKNPTDTAVLHLMNSICEIPWILFCKNPNDHVINYIISIISENRNDKRIFWASLCENQNPRVVDILRNNKDKIVWASFLKNPNCFKYNYEMMRQRCLSIKEEIEAIFLTPENIMALIERERNGDENDFEVMSRLN